MDQSYWEQLALEIDLANNLFVPPDDYEPTYLDRIEQALDKISENTPRET